MGRLVVEHLALPFQKMFAILLARVLASSDDESEFLSAIFETGVFLLIPASNDGLSSLMSKAQARLAGCRKDASTRMDNTVEEHTGEMTKAMSEAKIKPYLKKGV